MNERVESWCERDEHSLYDLYTDFNEWLEGDEAQEIRETYGIDALSHPSKALYAGDRKAYDLELEEYRTKRRHEVLNELFFSEQFGDDHWFAHNVEHFNQLVKRLEDGDVVPFIGAGISKDGGFPTWEEHLRTQGRTAGLGMERVEELLTSGKYERVIELIESQHGREVFENEIRDAFSRTGSITETTLLITELFTDTLITTNYDRLLEQACDTGAENAYEVINCFKAMQTPDAERTSIIKLHGDISAPTHCILGKNQYNEAYGNGDIDMSLPIPKLLEYYYTNNSLLFLGSSLNNDRTVHVFRAIKEQLKKDKGDIYIPQHFCVEQAPETEEALTARNAYLAQLGITPIWFEPGRYEYVESILRMARNELRYLQKPLQMTNAPEVSAKTPCNLELEFNEFLRDFTDVLPLLHWLHRYVPQNETSKYVQTLQRFFYAHNIFTESTEKELIWGLDNLSRAFAMNPNADGYTHGKLLVAFKAFQKFLKSTGESAYDTKTEWDTHELLTLPLIQFEQLIETPSNLSNQDLGAVRIIIALLRHGKRQQYSPKEFCKLPDALNIEFGNYISERINEKLGLRLPDHLHEDELEELHRYCETAWKSNGEFDELSSGFLGNIRKILLLLRS